MLHFTVCAYIAINNHRRVINSRVIFGDMYISRVISEHCDWSTEKMRQLDLCGFNLSTPTANSPKILSVTFSNFTFK